MEMKGIPDTDEQVGAIVRRMETNYLMGETRISKYVMFNQYENISKIDAYLNSKHISGEYDAMGREKPFFNIVTSAVNIWFRATDIDRKDITIMPTSSKSTTAAFLATIKLQDWMRRENFGVFLNDWGRSLAAYGSSVVKFVEQGGKLHASVVPWNRLISDTIDFENNPKIEMLELTEAQLRSNPMYDQDQVDALCNAVSTRQLINREQVDNKADYIKIYEVHGEFSLATLKMAQGKDILESDYDDYVQQMHVISFVANTSQKGDFSDFTLYSGKEAKDPYMITHLIKEDGRAQSIGAVEHLFDAQWMQNHTIKQMKDQLDLASKLIFQTSDGNFVGQNALLAIENGDILVHELNQPLTQVGNNSHDITSLQNFQTNWKALGQELTNTPDALRGNNQPSNTPYSSVALLSQNASSLFELMTENKGLHVEDMLTGFIIPHVKKQLNNKDEIAATLDEYNIKKIDQMYVPKEAVKRYNQKFIKDLIKGTVPEAFDQQGAEQGVQNEMNSTGNMRFIDPEEVTWKEVFKDLEWDVEVQVTNEQSDKQTALTTLNTLLQTIMAKQGQPFSPQEQLIVNRILVASGQISPLELAQVQAQQQSQPQQLDPAAQAAAQQSPVQAATPAPV